MGSTKMKYPKNRINAQMVAANINKVILKPKTKLYLRDVIFGSIYLRGMEIPNDYIICVDKMGRPFKIKMQEYLRLTSRDFLYSDYDMVYYELPKSITILSSKDRTDEDGNIIYPNCNYNGVEEFYATNSLMTLKELRASGLRNKLYNIPMQDYVVSVSSK